MTGRPGIPTSRQPWLATEPAWQLTSQPFALRILALELLFQTGEIRKKISLEESRAITDGSAVQTVTATKAHSMIYKLIDDASDSHEPIQITGKRSNAVLVAEDDWRAIQESLYLVSIPDMRESIRSGLATSVSACAKKLDW